VGFRKTLSLVLKVILLTIVMFILFSVGSSFLGPPVDASQMTPEQASRSGMALITICLIDTIVLVYLILRSRLTGWRLMAVTGFAYYGAKTFLSAIEAWYFMTNLTPDMIPGLFLMTLPVALLFPPIAVWVLGKAKKSAEPEGEENTRLSMPAGQLIWKLAVLAVIVYPLLYFAFGYYVAMRSPALQSFYGIEDPGSFIAQLGILVRETPMVFPWQIFRGLLWVAVAAPVIRTTKGRAWEAGLIVALLFSIVMNDVHFIPNPLMPPGVQMAHFIETTPSNFIWGWAIVWLLHRRHTSLRDLFGSGPKSLEAPSGE
jgi:hypothetical protein